MISEFMGLAEFTSDRDALLHEYIQRYPKRESDLHRALAKVDLIREFHDPGGCLFPPCEFGEFQVIDELARGGMGIVYEAYQPKLNRRVALKVLRDQAYQDRFENEQNCLARFFQANIVPIYEAGEAESETGRKIQYLVMPLIDGSTLDALVSYGRTLRGSGIEKIKSVGQLANRPKGTQTEASESDRPNLPTLGRSYYRSVALCMIDIAKAASEGHRLGIVHRDLKPSNIMVSKEGRAFIIDYGLASSPESDADPQAGDPQADDPLADRRSSGRIGTLGYRAPEQEQYESTYSPQTDVWGMGCVLYELLAFRPAFSDADDDQNVHAPGANVRVTPPIEIDPTIPADLSAITMRCLERVQGLRYPSADELADELNRWLNDVPVRARRLTAWEGFQKWRRRRPTLAASGAIAAVGVVAAMLGLVLHVSSLRAINKKLENSIEETRARESEIRHFDYALHMNQGFDAWRRGDLSRVNDMLIRDYQSKGAPDLRGFESHLLNGAAQSEENSLADGEAAVTSVAYLPDAGIVTGNTLGRVSIWDPSHRVKLKSLRAHQSAIAGLAISHDGQCAVTGSSSADAQLWKLPAWDPITSLSGHLAEITSVSSAAATPRFATAAADGVVLVWEVDSKTCRRVATLQHREPVWDAELSADGRLLVATLNNRLTVWDVDGAKKKAELQSTQPLRQACFDGQADRIYAAGVGRSIQVWRVSSGNLVREFGDFAMDCSDMAFSSSSKLMLTSNRNGSICVWDLVQGRLLRVVLGHTGGQAVVDLHPQGKRFTSAGRDGLTKQWFAFHSRCERVLSGHLSLVTGLAFGPDGEKIVSGSQDQSLTVWDVQRGEPLVRFGETTAERDPITGQAIAWDSKGGHVATVLDVDFSPGGDWCVSADLKGYVRVWNAASGLEHREIAHGITTNCVRFKPQGDRIAVAALDGSIRIWPAHANQEPTLRIDAAGHRAMRLEFRPDGARLASVDQSNRIRIWDTATGKERSTLTVGAAALRCVDWSPDGMWLAVGGDQHLYLVNAADGQVKWKMHGHRAQIEFVAFHPNEPRLASAAKDGTLRIWDTTNGEQVGVIDGRGPVAFSPSGNRIAYQGRGSTIQIWNAAFGRDAPRQQLPAAPVSREAMHSNAELVVRVLGSGKSSQLQGIPTTNKLFEAAEKHVYQVVALSAPAEMLRLKDKEYDELKIRRPGIPSVDRVVEMNPEDFQLSVGAQSYRGKLVSFWPESLGFQPYLLSKRSRPVDDREHVPMMIAFSVRESAHGPASVRFREKPAVAVPNHEVRIIRARGLD